MAASRIGSRRELSDGRRPLRGVRHRAEAARTRQVEMVCSHDRHVRLGMQSRRRPYPDDWCSPNGDSVAFAIDLPSQSSHRALANFTLRLSSCRFHDASTSEISSQIRESKKPSKTERSQGLLVWLRARFELATLKSAAMSIHSVVKF